MRDFQIPCDPISQLPNIYYAKNTPGCPSTCVCILHYGSQHAFLAILTHNPLCSVRQVTYVTACHANINKAEDAQTDGSTFKCKDHVLCTPKFCAKVAQDSRSKGSKVMVHCHDEVVSPNCVHTAGNRQYLLKIQINCMQFGTCALFCIS